MKKARLNEGNMRSMIVIKPSLSQKQPYLLSFNGLSKTLHKEVKLKENKSKNDG
jgi:hypothetical protein